MITAVDIVKKYGDRTILDGATLTVEAGQCVILTGDNGSGKTTLLHVMAGLRRADSGEVLWKGEPLLGADARAWRAARETWGFMPQQVGLPATATVAELVGFHARLRGRGREEAWRWVERVGLDDAGARRVAELSGGMRRRLGIALTLFFEPELIVMDEPASHLDPGWRRELAVWAEEEARRGAAILITSQLEEVWGPSTVRRHCSGGRIVDDADRTEAGPTASSGPATDVDPAAGRFGEEGAA